MLYSILFLFLSFFTQEPQVIPNKITNQLYVMYGGSGQGSHVGVFIGSKEIVLVDAMKSNAFDKLMREIRKISDLPITYVINTHSDNDHTENNEAFRKMGAKIINQADAKYSGVIGDLSFLDEMILRIDDEEIYMKHVISHSYNDALIYFKKNNAIFMGDTYTNSWYATFSTGGIEGQLDALQIARTFSNQKTVVVPGHGILSNIKQMNIYQQAAIEWRETISELYHQQKSVDDMTDDQRLYDIVQKFLDPSLNKTIPKKRIRRFIERTISSEMISAFPLSPQHLSQFVGSYKSDDGKTEKIELVNGRLIIRKADPYQSTYILIPVSLRKFHLKGSIDEYIILDSKSMTWMNSKTSIRFKKPDPFNLFGGN